MSLDLDKLRQDMEFALDTAPLPSTTRKQHGGSVLRDTPPTRRHHAGKLPGDSRSLKDALETKPVSTPSARTMHSPVEHTGHALRMESSISQPVSVQRSPVAQRWAQELRQLRALNGRHEEYSQPDAEEVVGSGGAGRSSEYHYVRQQLRLSVASRPPAAELQAAAAVQQAVAAQQVTAKQATAADERHLSDKLAALHLLLDEARRDLHRSQSDLAVAQERARPRPRPRPLPSTLPSRLPSPLPSPSP